MNYYQLKTKLPEVKFIFLGYFNCYKPDDMLILSPQLRQLVHYPTYGDKTLDLVITDMHTLYHPPQVIQPLLPDNPDAASPSDHLGSLLIPRSVPGKLPLSQKTSLLPFSRNSFPSLLNQS